MITRLVLCVWLIFTNPLSVTFRYLAVIIFCLPLLRYLIHKITRTEMDTIFSGSLPKDGGKPIILFLSFFAYILAVPHVFSVYHLSFASYLLVIVLPVIAAYLLVRQVIKDPDHSTTNEQALLTTMAFYILPFLAGINYAFDFSRPDTTQYYVTGTYDYTTGYSAEYSETTFYYLDLLPVDSAAGPLHWMQVSEKEYQHISPGRTSVNATINGVRYVVLEAERRLRSVQATSYGKRNGVAPDYFLQLIETNALVTRTRFKYRVYQRYAKGDYLYSDHHRGLLGFPWHSYL